MAASGLVGITEAAVIEMSMKHKIPRVQLVKLKGIFHGNFESHGLRNGSDIAKCLEKLNGVLPKQSLKTSLANFTGLFGKESFTNRLERSPSTDSIAVSNFSSDQGSIDSCHYSSNGSDSNSGSSPSSPEEPDRCSRAGSPQSIQGEEDPMDESYSADAIKYRTPHDLESRLQDSSEDSKLFYLQQTDCSVPNSSSFQSCVPVVRNGESSSSSSNSASWDKVASKASKSLSCSNSVSWDKVASKSSSSSSSSSNSASWDKVTSKTCVAETTKRKADFISSSGTNRSNCSSSSDLQQCNWVNCEVCLEGNTELVEHIRTQHVQVQKDKESFVCLWTGCKVYDRSSCSLSWLERHILSHGGTKPFKCIVDNCAQRFPTQAALQRHVNSHFDAHPNGHCGKAGKCRDDGSNKSSFRKKRNAKLKKKAAMGKIAEDFFDANVMEQIRYRLVEVHSSQHGDSTDLPGSITFHSRVRGVRTDKSGEVKVLLHWLPENILPDSWVPEKSVVKSKRVPYSSLPPGNLHPQFKEVLDGEEEAPRVKQRRK